jgi:hypothetical protein
MNTRSKRKIPDSIISQSKKPVKKRKAAVVRPSQSRVNNLQTLFTDPNSLIELIHSIDNEQDRINFFNSNFKVRREIKDIIEQYYNKNVMQHAIVKFLSKKNRNSFENNNMDPLFEYINHFWPTNFFSIIVGNPEFVKCLKNLEHYYVGILVDKIFLKRIPVERNVDHLLFIAFPELQLTGLNNFLTIKVRSEYEYTNDNRIELVKLLRTLSIDEIHGRLSNILGPHEMNIFETELLKIVPFRPALVFAIWNLIAFELMKNFRGYYSSLSPQNQFLLIKSYVTVM